MNQLPNPYQLLPNSYPTPTMVGDDKAMAGGWVGAGGLLVAGRGEENILMYIIKFVFFS